MGDRFRQLTDVGIFKDTLAPSVFLHTGLSVATWGIAKYTDRVEAKDMLWPAAFVINSWWSAVGRRVVAGVPLSSALSALSRPEWLLLTGVTTWGTRLFYRIVARSLARGKDDPRYAEVKKEPSFWTNTLINTFIPEALFSALIAVPFTAPFRHEGAVLTGYHPYVQAFSVGLFSTGFALEAIADYQQESHRKKSPNTLTREGVWSIVRRPNYLGDFLLFSAFPILLYSSDMLAPLELMGPIANFVFLRYFGGDKELELRQKERYTLESPEKRAQLDDATEKQNAFWPKPQEIKNKWTWVVLGCGVAGMALEQLLIDFLEY